jgi:hypothetical protein
MDNFSDAVNVAKKFQEREINRATMMSQVVGCLESLLIFVTAVFPYCCIIKIF